jgi:RNA polymerase sigma factor (sigma-70 family)
VQVLLGDGALANALASLSPTERRVLELRFGLSGQDPVSLQKCGEELGMTRERVRKLEQSALEQLSRNRELLEEREAA